MSYSDDKTLKNISPYRAPPPFHKPCSLPCEFCCVEGLLVNSLSSLLYRAKILCMRCVLVVVGVPVLVGFSVHYDEGLGHRLHPSACRGS